MGTTTSACARWSICRLTRSCVLMGLTQKVGPTPCMIPDDERHELRSPCFQFLTGECDHVYCTADENGQTAPDDCCERFIHALPNQNYCSRMRAICPKAPTCYGENVEHSDTDCSEGMVLCTDVDNEDNRYMYDRKDLEFLDNKVQFESRVCWLCGTKFSEVVGSSHSVCKSCRTASVLEELFPAADDDFDW